MKKKQISRTMGIVMPMILLVTLGFKDTLGVLGSTLLGGFLGFISHKAWAKDIQEAKEQASNNSDQT
ncbi:MULTISPECIES: hypothetical protein [Aerococcus]|uniref:Uncharacterized protein n=1 Tax=Aerococcus sanguinicola TaxID=119206 RepID=A0A5N1GGX7_9LACT|nr:MULTISPECIES: hypothetical protein [Aerococcus]KAA9299644.1 hypothetical protein F6I03_09245 [Aerococcus sanguinicola]MDK6369967.1 hypothetical protein [Aerococcus sp. UMB9870]MDK6680559.1 hypothetical protein [Aerococcus sp. UMB8608]MDK6687389.1 hypothetical protein [Aerococcus sp. UMB8623]MDK6940490.1 hypothetical protein [Aerococcus sp. UMB8487]